jgi:hypothetical protein
MRFFSLDPAWINCLLAGACSVGRDSGEEDEVDEVLRKQFLNYAIQDALTIRQRPPDDHARDAVNQPAPQKPAAAVWPMEGFIIRSPVVEGWQGLEMRAWSKWSEGKGDPVEPVRLDRLGPDVMLCIFNGPVCRIEIRQPPESMHFGADLTEHHTAYVKYVLRKLDAAEAGDQINTTVKPLVTLKMLGPRAIDFATLADDLQNELQKSGNGGLPAGSFTSAEMGVEMTDAPGRIVFYNSNYLTEDQA